MTRLEILCKLHNQQGGTIHDFNKTYGVDVLNLNNRNFFKLLYGANLKRAHGQWPDKYVWPAYELLNVMERMFAAIDKGSFNKDGLAFKWTCKQLGIKHTYQAIFNYFGESNHVEIQSDTYGVSMPASTMPEA